LWKRIEVYASVLPTVNLVVRYLIGFGLESWLQGRDRDVRRMGGGERIVLLKGGWCGLTFIASDFLSRARYISIHFSGVRTLQMDMARRKGIHTARIKSPILPPEFR
jgi:hypothetical protein